MAKSSIVLTFVLATVLLASLSAMAESSDVAWGESKAGLQLGIRAPRSVQQGDPSAPVINGLLRNISDHPVHFSMVVPNWLGLRISDQTGKDISISGPVENRPVQRKEFSLDPGKQMELSVRNYLFAQGLPIYCRDKDVQVAHTVPGAYRIAGSFDVGFGDFPKKFVRLISGATEVAVTPPDTKRVTDLVFTELKKHSDRFNLKIYNIAEHAPRLRSVWLTVLKAKSAYPDSWDVVQISRAEAEAIIDRLAEKDYLWRTVTEGPYDMKRPEPRYALGLDMGDDSDPKDIFPVGSIDLGQGAELNTRLSDLRDAFPERVRHIVEEIRVAAQAQAQLLKGQTTN